MGSKISDEDRRLTEQEALLIIDSFNGHLCTFDARNELVMTVDDAITEAGLAEKWDVDAVALLDRLRRLADGTAWAVLDAIEAYWRQPKGRPLATALRESGLTSIRLGRDSTPCQPPLPEPFESMNAVDSFVERERFTSEALGQFLGHPDGRVRDYARSKLPVVR